jgi:hypothetical protein
MHRIGGTLLIHSESGRGTEVVMRLRHTPEGSMLSAEDQEEYYSES